MKSDFEGLECTIFIVGACLADGKGVTVFLACMALLSLISYSCSRKIEEREKAGEGEA